MLALLMKINKNLIFAIPVAMVIFRLPPPLSASSRAL